MQFSKHIDKAFWIFADKLLTVIFGFLFIRLSLSAIPIEEWGIFSILYYSLFLLIINFGSSLALQPMMKFLAESDDNQTLITAGFIINLLFLALALFVIYFFDDFFVRWFASNAQEGVSIKRTIAWLPVLMVSFVFRNFFIYIFQAKYQVIRIFFIDGVYFISTIALFYAFQTINILSGAADLILINIISYGLSSLTSIALGIQYLKISFREIKHACRKILDFGCFNLVSSIANNIYEQLDQYIVITLLNPKELGIYASMKIFLRIFSVFTQIVQNLLIPVLSRQFANKAREVIMVLFEKAVCFSTIALIPLGLSYLLFPEILLKIITDKGEILDHAVILQIASGFIVFIPWASVFGCVYVAANKMKLALLVNIAAFAINLFFVFFMTKLFGLYGTISGTVISGILVTAINIFIIQKTALVDIRPLSIALRIRDIKYFINDFLTPSKERK